MSFETPASNHLANVQSLRGFAALLVVFSHLLVIETKYSPDHVLGSWLSFGQVGVDLFFVISGFIMVHVAAKMQRGAKPAFEFLFARFTRIYPLYWLVSAALLIVWLVRPGMVFSSFKTEPNIIKSFLLFPDSRDPLLAVGWTLIHEIGFYLVFALALLLKPKWLLPFLCLWAGIIGAGQFMDIGSNSINEAVIALFLNPLTFEFLGGALAGWVFHKWDAKFALPVLLTGLGLWTIALFVLISAGHTMIESPLGRVIHFALPATLTVYGLAGLKTTLPKCTQTLGDWSYSLYLTHILSLTLFGRIWHKFAQDGKWDNIPALAVMTIASIIVAGLTYKLAEKPMLNAAKNLRRRLFPPA